MKKENWIHLSQDSFDFVVSKAWTEGLENVWLYEYAAKTITLYVSRICGPSPGYTCTGYGLIIDLPETFVAKMQ
jgi:hypothetical protein